MILSGDVCNDDFTCTFSLALLISVDLLGITSLLRQLWIEQAGPSTNTLQEKTLVPRYTYTYVAINHKECTVYIPDLAFVVHGSSSLLLSPLPDILISESLAFPSELMTSQVSL